MMVRLNDADALIGGLTTHYPDTIRPALQVIDVRPELRRVAGVYVMITQKGDIYFLADATVNIEPTAEDLAEIAIMAAEKARRFNQEPRVAITASPISAARVMPSPTRSAVQWTWSARRPRLMIVARCRPIPRLRRISSKNLSVQYAERRR